MSLGETKPHNSDSNYYNKRIGIRARIVKLIADILTFTTDCRSTSDIITETCATKQSGIFATLKLKTETINFAGKINKGFILKLE